jgi:PRTRC genetic system protein C
MATKRIIAYDNREFSDPDPTQTMEEVKKTLSGFFPELATATIREHKKDGEPDTVIYEFVRQTGTKGTETPWVMPDWMEKYRPIFVNTGRNTIERLMNDKSTTDTNLPLSILSCCASSQVEFLTAMKNKGFLSQDL